MASFQPDIPHFFFLSAVGATGFWGTENALRNAETTRGRPEATLYFLSALLKMVLFGMGREGARRI